METFTVTALSCCHFVFVIKQYCRCSQLSSSYWLMSKCCLLIFVKLRTVDVRLVEPTFLPFHSPIDPQVPNCQCATVASLRRGNVHCDRAHVQPPERASILSSDKTMTASQRDATCVYSALFGKKKIKVTFILLRGLSLLLLSQAHEEIC